MKKYFYILLFVCFSVVALGSNNPRKFYADGIFTIKDGLSNSRVTCLMQDSKGFLWIGTHDGLNRFDGYEFKIFRHWPFDSTSISNNLINGITEDKDGNIWVATAYGLSRYNRKKGEFTRYLHNPADPSSIRDNFVYSVYYDKKGVIWAKTLETLEKIDIETNAITHYKHYSDPFTYVYGRNFQAIYKDSKNTLWIGTKDGLVFFDEELEIFNRYYHQEQNRRSISNNRIKDVCEDKDGNIWIATANGLNKFNRQTENFSRFFHHEYYANSLANNHCNVVYPDNSGMIWVGSAGGLNKIDPAKDELTAYKMYDVNDIQKNIHVSAIVEDESNILWIGTLRGLIKYDKKGKKFNLYASYKGNVKFSSDIITAIYADNDVIWLGTWGGGVNMFNRKIGRVINYSEDNDYPGYRISNNNVHAIFKDSRHRIWIGTNNGVDIFNRMQMCFYSFADAYAAVSADVFKNNKVFDIIEDNNDNIWFTTNRGLFKFSYKTNSFDQYYEIYDKGQVLQLNRIHTAVPNGQNKIWLGTDNGLILYDYINRQYTHYTLQKNKSEGLSSNTIYSLLDKDSVLWIGTSYGLNRLNKNNKQFTTFNENYGLPNNIIYAIEEDDKDNLWMSTNKGIIQFNPATEEHRIYDVYDGLQGYEFSLGASCKSNNNELFFGGTAGFNSFFPDSIKHNEHIPNIVITAFDLLGEKEKTEIYPGKKGKIVVPPFCKIFTVEFAALDYSSPGENHYSYSMTKEGHKENWINIGTKHSATFSNLSPGHYVFKVIGSNNDLAWNVKGTALNIHIKAPFYKTNIAYYTYGLVLVILIMIIIRVRTKNLRQSNRVLREKEEAAKKIAEQREKLALINKDITDSINYAKRIQEAMLPSLKTFKKILPDSFVLYKPKSIVSGDFYWVNSKNDKILVATADCTGHGVPGAFMSLIGIELFRRNADILGVEKPANILNELNNDFANIFNDIENTTLRDGMDVALCSIDIKKKQLEFAGAFNPLYIIRDEKIIEIKGNRFSVGLSGLEEDKNKIFFNNHVVDLKKDDIIYMFTDGYVDQFGGPREKKYKKRRFRHLLLNIYNHPIEKQREILEKNIDDWRGPHEQIDDILIIGIKPNVDKPQPKI